MQLLLSEHLHWCCTVYLVLAMGRTVHAASYQAYSLFTACYTCSDYIPVVAVAGCVASLIP